MNRKFLASTIFSSLILFLALARANAEVPNSIAVQGRATTPLTTLNGTATILPAGLSQSFSADTDANGVFQFNLTGLSADAFTDPISSLRLEIGTATINIPFTSVPFAFRAASADSLVTGAPMEFVTINVTTVTATTINVTTITANMIVASQGTIQGELNVFQRITVGSGTITLNQLNNSITFSGQAGAGGTIETAAPQPGPLTLQTAGNQPINLYPGGPGLVNINNTFEFSSAQNRLETPTSAFTIQSSNGNNLRLNQTALLADILMVEGGGNVGIGVPAATPPADKLHVAGNARTESATPAFVWQENDQTLPAGLWRTQLEGDNLFFEKNVAPAGDFSAIATPLTITSIGNMGVGIITPNSRLAIQGAGNDATTSGLNVANSAGASALFVRDDGFIGISTGAPQFKMHIQGGAGFSGDILVISTGISDIFRVTGLGKVHATSFVGDGSQLTGIIAGAADSIANDNDVIITADSVPDGTGSIFLRTGFNDRLIIRNNGNVGIGTTGPNSKLEVNGNIELTEPAANSGVRMGTSGAVRIGAGGGSAIEFFKESDGSDIIKFITHHYAVAGKERMRIDRDGNVGIGITRPSAKGHIYSAAGTADSILRLQHGSAGLSRQRDRTGKLEFGGITGGIVSAQIAWHHNYYYNYGTDISFSVMDQSHIMRERMRITHNGNVGIGTTRPLYKLDLRGTFCAIGSILATGNLQIWGTKAFVQDHPRDPSKIITYYTQEGPEVGTYVRGTAYLSNGLATVELPEHFGLVTSSTSELTVQVTPMEDCNGLFVAETNTSRIVVKELNKRESNAKFSYLVQGVRKGYENEPVIQDKEILGGEYGQLDDLKNQPDEE